MGHDAEEMQVDTWVGVGSCIEDLMVYILVDHDKASHVQAFGAEQQWAVLMALEASWHH